MPEKKTLERAKKDKRAGKSPGTQAGEFVHEEIEHIRHGKHGARSPEQAIAIGLSKARRAGVKLPPPKKGRTSEATREQAVRDLAKGKRSKKTVSRKRSRASTRRLRRYGKSAVSSSALARHARKAAKKHTAAERSAAARKASRTKGPTARKAAARKAARTRARKTTSRKGGRARARTSRS